MGVSCATPVLGAVWGASAVAGASVLAGQAARAVLQWPSGGGAGNGAGRVRSWSAAWLGGRHVAARDSTPWDEREMTTDAIVGSLLYAVLGRGMRSAMPSDVSHPGALARMSMPANGAHYASESQKRTLAGWLRRDGCHHCGTKVGPVIGDHMPPNKLAYGSSAAAEAARNGTLTARQRIWNFIRGVPKQRFFPQCRSCSDIQSTAVRMNAKRLVMHNGGMTVGVAVAVAVAARHYAMHYHPEEYARFEKRVEDALTMR